ncbi:MAG: DUF4416 domain-containing protein [Candidatus Zixiibacteriota bacterium]|nr:MAG: DUF4416 domain-containing protein [candidate division Zixibacteria bacterium]
MGRTKKPLPGKLILSAIYSVLGPMHDAIEEIERKFGVVEFETDELEFLHTTYYREEMGDDLKRKFFAFEGMVARDRLAEIKIWTNRLEEKYGEKVDDFVFRKVNLDPGILSLANLVLASTKDYSHRIYLKDGIFSEVTLIYEKKRFKALPWTYPDYTEPEVIGFLSRVRETMKGMEYDI